MKKILLNVCLLFALFFTTRVMAADGTGPMDPILNAVSLDGVLAWVGITGAVIVTIALAFKGIDIAKRGVKKA